MTEPNTPAKPPPAVEIRGLHFHYNSSDGQIHDISFSVEAGQCVALVGPNGAGKSTILLHLNGLLPESFNGVKPAVFVHGRPVAPPLLDAIRREVGLLFQDADDQLFCPTVLEDVSFGPAQLGLTKPQITAIAAESLASVGLAGFETRSPHRLSGGEKRRVCLAGILACRPTILALDEPTNGLDPRGRRELIALLRTLPSTKIIATHDLDLVVQICSHAILLDHGAVIACGPTAQILGDEPLMLAHGLEMPAALRRA